MLGAIGSVILGSAARTAIDKFGGEPDRSGEVGKLSYADERAEAINRVSTTQARAEKGVRRYAGKAQPDNTMQRLLNEVYGPAYRSYPMIVQRIIAQAQSEGHSKSVIRSTQAALKGTDPSPSGATIKVGA